MATLVETKLSSALKESVADSSADAVIGAWSCLDVLMDRQCEAKLASYLLSSVRASVDSNFTISTDKAWCCGLPLQNSFISWPNGFAAACAPQVALTRREAVVSRVVILGVWAVVCDRLVCPMRAGGRHGHGR